MRDFTHPVDDAYLVKRADVGREAGVHTQHTAVDDGLWVWQTQQGGGVAGRGMAEGWEGKNGSLGITCVSSQAGKVQDVSNGLGPRSPTVRLILPCWQIHRMRRPTIHGQKNRTWGELVPGPQLPGPPLMSPPSVTHRQRQEVKDLRAVPPGIGVPVLSLAFVIEAVPAGMGVRAVSSDRAPSGAHVLIPCPPPQPSSQTHGRTQVGARTSRPTATHT